MIAQSKKKKHPSRTLENLQVNFDHFFSVSVIYFTLNVFSDLKEFDVVFETFLRKEAKV